MPTTFHGTFIGNHDLKIVDDTDITIDFLGNVMVNKIMCVVTIDKDYEFPILNVSNWLEGLGSRESSEEINSSTSSGSLARVV